MPLRLPFSLDPFAARLSAAEVKLRTFRLVMGLVVALMPVFGVAYGVALPEAVDPWWMRLGLMGVCGVLLMGSYAESVRMWYRRRAGMLLSVLSTALLTWCAALMWANDLAVEYVIGYTFVFVSGALLYTLAGYGVRPFATLLGIALATSVALAFAVPEPRMSPVLLALSLLGMSLSLLFAVHARSRILEEVERKEATLAEAERLGAIGSWSHDTVTGWRHWSDGMFRLIGEHPRSGRPPLMFDYVHPDDLAARQETEHQMKVGLADGSDARYRIVRADGAVREVRSIVRVERGPDRAVLRAYGVVTDETEQAEHERALDRARIEAEDGARLKAAILANMSHEIRTPLTAVIGYAQLLAEQVGPEHLDLVLPIQNGGTRLLETLNSVLDLARLEAGRMELSRSPVDAAAEADGVAALLAGRARERGLLLIVDAPVRPVWALTDRAALCRVLTNLASNAVKFTDHGSVTLRVFREAESVRIDVIDTGRGMSEAFVPRLFEAFRQESTGESRSHEGSGLGLTITHRLVGEMGGAISVESAVGEGTTFTVRLPASGSVPPPPAAGAAWVSRGDGGPAFGASPVSAGPVSAPAGSAPPSGAPAPESISGVLRRGV